ncbi:hypothetical protein AO373_0068 [Moraxella catarrhalis]|uniref:hypothetical protein n=1 Tax=Moraxella catarrhalis TaxID=480 RepID=UPI0007E49468|nr:hypothetical protein [Moraxella catarrhalis]OAV05437.1 hypothetical protein AO379_1514 [Moraxella catarrhalis]OAV21393.1 hypothetical protein AO373_0068 [Moraxella catarrhalis]
MQHHTLIAHQFDQAIRQATLSVRFGFGAIVCFCLFGTLASLPMFKDSIWIYYAFHYLPYTLIAITIPISLYHGFLLRRYRVMDGSILAVILATGMALLGFAVVWGFSIGIDTVFFMALFLAMIAWFGMPFLFRVNLKKFASFLEEKSSKSPQAPI